MYIVIMDDIILKYGLCSVPRGKLLWSFQHNKWSPDDQEVFTFADPHHEWDNDVKFTLQTTRDLKFLAPFDISQTFGSVSYLPALYDEIMDVGLHETNKGTLSFKENCTIRRPFLERLGRLHIDGWIHPVERRSIYYIELCILNSVTCVNIVPTTSVIDYHVLINPGYASIRLNNLTKKQRKKWAILHEYQMKQVPWSWTPLNHLRI